MLRRIPFGLLLLVALIFVGLGDQFLPQPLSGASFKTRTALNEMLYALVPAWRPQVAPYQRTEDALKREEGTKPSP